MKFILECDRMDGLVFIDKSYLIELNSDVRCTNEKCKKN